MGANDKVAATYHPWNDPNRDVLADINKAAVDARYTFYTKMFEGVDWDAISDAFDQFIVGMAEIVPTRSHAFWLWVTYLDREFWDRIWSTPTRRQVRKMAADADARLHIRWAAKLLEGKPK